jgi:hypothetical protein
MVLVSVVYSLFGRLLALVILRGRGDASKDIELLVPRKEVDVLAARSPDRLCNLLTGWFLRR